MGGGAAAGTARLRIKGRKLSVIRFLILSIAYTTPWIIMLSQLAYYSKNYGPQVLLQLNLAYYLPSIPILLLAGHIEKLLDEQFGTTASMAIRLTAGLSGCAAIAASYPFISSRLKYLLWLVVALGSISAVAFSTSYQLVAWFRSADTIALGIGCVASGPLALVIQLALHIGTTPKRWQWIGLFEAAAGLVLVGLLAALSLFWQYWGILSGTEPYDDRSMPLLDSAEQAQQDHADNEAGEQALMLSRMITMQDPFQGFPYTTTPGLAYPYLQPLIRRAASDDLSEYRRQSNRANTARTLNRHHTSNPQRTTAQRAAAASAAAAAQSLLLRKSAASNVSHHQSLQQVVVQSQQQYGGYQAPSDDPYYYSDSGVLGVGGTGDLAVSTAAMPGQHTANSGTWWADPDYHSPAAGIVGSVTSSSVHSSRPASPSPIPSAAARVSSYVEDLPEYLVSGRNGYVATSAPVNTSASLLDADEQLELLSRLAAVPAAHHDLDHFHPSDDPASSGNLSQGPSSPAHYHSGHAATAGAMANARGSGAKAMLRSHKDNVLQLSTSRSPSASPAQTPRSAAAAIAPAAAWQAPAAAVASKQQQQAAAAKPPLPAHVGPQQQQQLQEELQQLLQQPRHKRNISAGSACSAFSAASVQSQSLGDRSEDRQDAERGYARVGSAGDMSAAAAGGGGGSEVTSSVKDEHEPEGLGRVYGEVFSYTWMVVLAALISSTLLNCIFPFFTYVESSGMLGEFLPQVLFYTRMLSDIVGRLLPRKKVLAITSPVALLSLSGTLLVAAVGFFVYLQAPPRMQYDPYVLALVLTLWLGGGYINTMGYILAPCLVPPRLCTKSAAIMVLVYKASHILGLMAAIGIALWLYGDISGAL